MDLIEANRKQIWSEKDPYTIERYQQFIHHIGLAEATVLDCGCNTGQGGYTMKSANKSWKIWGSELVPDRVSFIKQGIYDRILIGSAETLEVSDNKFDAIVAGEVVEHIPSEILINVLQEFHRVLKTGGRIFLTTPNPNSYLIKLGNKSVYNDPSHVNIMPINVLTKYILDCGFSIERILGSGKATRIFGEKFPLINVYGSYLIIAKKIID